MQLTTFAALVLVSAPALAQTGTRIYVYRAPGSGCQAQPIARADRMPPPTYNGPGDTPGTPPPASGAGGASEPTSGPAQAEPSAPTSGAADAVSMPWTSYDAFWWLWWLDNYPRFLHPKRLPSTEEARRYGDLIARSRFDGEHAEVRERIRAQLASGSGAVRARAAIALGRLGGAQAVDDLLPLLADPAREVRDSAILALGATGNESAVAPLFDLAQDGRLGERTGEVSPIGQPLALVALGIGRRLGMSRTVELRVQQLLGDLDPDADSDVLLGGMLFKDLAGADNLDLRASALACDEELPFEVRCRALEQLGRTFEQDSLALLVRELTGKDLERRRSAAFGLASLDDGLVLEPLVRAFHAERESTTRSLILLAIGERGGADGRPFLEEVLEQGPTPQRCWAAIALAICLREAPEAERGAAGKAIRRAFERDRSASRQGAYVIAAGILRDASSTDWMRALLSGADSTLRMAAAYGLAMIGGDEQRAALIAGLSVEPSALGKAAMAEMLAYFGNEGDTEQLAATYRSVTDPALRGAIALAIGMHGSPAGLAFLRAELDDPQVSGPVRAGVLEALGLILGRHASFLLSELVQGTNPGAFPAWLRDVTAYTL